jgi:DNA replication protein DnaC
MMRVSRSRQVPNEDAQHRHAPPDVDSGLPTFAREYAVVAAQAAREGLSHEAYLLALATQEASERAARRVLFAPTFQIVQRLLAAKRDLRLAAELKRLDRFEALILNDLGYVQQSREEMEVLFTLLAERYERRSVVITSNLVFSKWDQIFKDPMTTAAVVDRVVRHAVILELPIPSYRAQATKARSQAASVAAGA